MLFDIPISLKGSKPPADTPVCPCCAQRFHHEAECCPLCGFSFERAQEKFGDYQIAMRRIDDKAGCLRKAQRENLAKKFSQWEKKCPPVVFAVHIPLSVEHQQLRQYATWALNSMEIGEGELDRPNWTILLVVDINNKAAAFSYGYKLDAYLTEDILYPALLAGSTYLRDSQYEQGIARMMKKAKNILIKQARNQTKRRHRLPPERKEQE